MNAITSDIVVPVTPTAGLISVVHVKGYSVQVSSPLAIGGYVYNPVTANDQGLSVASILYVDPTGPAFNRVTNTTVALQPGDKYEIPPEANGVWVNSNSSGHKFTVVQVLQTEIVQPTYIAGTFPPTGPTGVLSPILSYLYQEYSDDDDLQAFVAAYNSMMQDIVDTFNGLNLPNYTQDPVSGALLDWVGQGVYGISRPSLTWVAPNILGPYNTGEYNTQVYDYYKYEAANTPALVNDDIYRRCITWHVSKREGKYFNIEWLKKRVMQFLLGINGKVINIDNTYQISVTFGANCDVAIRLVLIDRIISGAIYNDSGFQYNSYQYNETDSTIINYPALPDMTVFSWAVNSGVLELPFMFKWDPVVIG
jgi:hypothetical protein